MPEGDSAWRIRAQTRTSRRVKFTKFTMSGNIRASRPAEDVAGRAWASGEAGWPCEEHSRNTARGIEPPPAQLGLDRACRTILNGRGRRAWKMAGSIGIAALLAALALSPETAAATQVAHSPWLGIRIVQDGRPVRLVRTDLRTVEARLAPRPFRILFPKRRADIAYQLCAWTGKSIFRALRPRAVAGEPNAGGEHPCFAPGTGMADTEAGSGMLMLSDSGHNYLIDLRLGPDPERPSVYYSALWTRAAGQVPISGGPAPGLCRRLPRFGRRRICRQRRI